jgi:hypothetical protein
MTPQKQQYYKNLNMYGQHSRDNIRKIYSIFKENQINLKYEDINNIFYIIIDQVFSGLPKYKIEFNKDNFPIKFDITSDAGGTM